MAEVICKHVDKEGLTTNYHDFGNGKEPLIKCDKCGKRLTAEEFLERVNYVAKCHNEGKPYA